MSMAKLGFALIIVGIVVIFVAALLPFLVSIGKPSVRGGVGGCVVIFFVPICFGTGTEGMAMPLMLIAMILAIVIIALAYIVFRAMARTAMELSAYT